MARGKKSAQAASRRAVNAEFDREEAQVKLTAERTMHRQVVADLQARIQTLVSDFNYQVDRAMEKEREEYQHKLSELDLDAQKARYMAWHFFAEFIDFQTMGPEDAKKIADWIGVPIEFLLGPDRKLLSREDRRALGGHAGGFTRYSKLRQQRLEKHGGTG